MWRQRQRKMTAAFALLKALLGQRIVCLEVYEVMDKVGARPHQRTTKKPLRPPAVRCLASSPFDRMEEAESTATFLKQVEPHIQHPSLALFGCAN